jgi:predicted nucleic acid-binding protein
VSIVVADAGPPRYLVLIDQIELLPHLFGKVVLPDVVRDELNAPQAPAQVRVWLASSPPWLEAGSAPAFEKQLPVKLDNGERAAIALAMELGASLILMDDRAGVEEARLRGLQVTGTLGVLILAARRGLVDLEAALARLKATNFRYPPALLDALLVGWRAGGKITAHDSRRWRWPMRSR